MPRPSRMGLLMMFGREHAPVMVPNVAPGKKVIIVVTCSRSITQAEKVSKSIRDAFETCGFEFESEILFSDDFGRLSAADDAETMTFAKGMGLRFRNT